jgi:hypothetical protein
MSRLELPRLPRSGAAAAFPHDLPSISCRMPRVGAVRIRAGATAVPYWSSCMRQASPRTNAHRPVLCRQLNSEAKKICRRFARPRRRCCSSTFAHRPPGRRFAPWANRRGVDARAFFLPLSDYAGVIYYGRDSKRVCHAKCALAAWQPVAGAAWVRRATTESAHRSHPSPLAAASDPTRRNQHDVIARRQSNIRHPSSVTAEP